MEKRELIIFKDLDIINFKKLYGKWIQQFQLYMKQPHIRSLTNAQFYDYHFTDFMVRKSYYPNGKDTDYKFFYVKDNKKTRISEKEFNSKIRNRKKDTSFLYYKISYMYPLMIDKDTFVTFERFNVKESNISKTGEFMVAELRSNKGKNMILNLLKINNLDFKIEKIDYDNLIKEILGTK